MRHLCENGSFQMSETHNQQKHKNLKEAFDNVVKKILNYETRELPEDNRESRINEYKIELIGTYNNLITYIGNVYANVNENSKSILKEAVSNRKLRILRALPVFGLTVDLPERFEQIDLDSVVGKDDLASGGY